MALIPARRRYLGPTVLGLLVLIMLGALIPDPVGTWQRFKPPEAKASLTASLNALSRAVNSYVSDNFAYARSLPYLRGMIAEAFDSPPNPTVYLGQHAHLYYNSDNMVGQSAGSLYRADEVRHFADVVEATRRHLAEAGADLVVLIPPNAQSMPSRDQPRWWHVTGPLEYDLAIQELRRRGITTIDLKAAFSAMPDVNSLYRLTDTHWRWKAALLAFNMAMTASGHDEWSLDPATSLSPLAPTEGGDLARLLGAADYYGDQDYQLRLPPAPDWHPVDVLRSPPFLGAFVPYAFERAPDGARILVLGDSFTEYFWKPLLLQSGASRIGWMHFALCAFDFTDVERFRPSTVIIAPTERLMPCEPKQWPHGLPREGTMATR